MRAKYMPVNFFSGKQVLSFHKQWHELLPGCTAESSIPEGIGAYALPVMKRSPSEGGCMLFAETTF